MRPSWQIDLKWCAGIVACLAVVVTAALFSLAHLTERDTAQTLSTALISSGINDRVTDDEFTALQSQASAHPNLPVGVGPVSVKVQGSEIAGLSRADASRVFAARLAAVLYDDGSGHAKSLIATERIADKDPISLGPVGVLSKENHSRFQLFFAISAAVAFAALAIVAAMSRGAGRLGAPAVVIALATAPAAGLWALANVAIGDGSPGDNAAILAARQAARSAAGDLRGIFLVAFAAAAGVVVLSFVGGTIAGFVVRRRARRAPLAAPAPTVSGRPQSLVETEAAS